MELAHVIETQDNIVDSANSYGAYALIIADEHTLKTSLGRLADDGIKGNRADCHFWTIQAHWWRPGPYEGFDYKSEWTGLACSTTTVGLQASGDKPVDPELTRV